MLDVRDITVCYGGLKALEGARFQVKAGQLVSLIGSNGAGKSTTLKALMGLIPVTDGSVYWGGRNMAAASSADRVNQGFALSPEGRRLFPRMTVLDNLLTGAHTVRSSRQRRASLDLIYTIFPRVAERLNQLAGSLSGGEQQMVAIGRALMSQPKILMLDEPSLGLAPKAVSEIAVAIKRIMCENQMAVILVEQNARLALQLADYAYVYEQGRIIHSGPGTELLNDPFVQKAYLGI